MKLKDMLKLVVDAVAVRWIDNDGIGKFINNQDFWSNDDPNEVFTPEQLDQEVEYFTIVDDEIIIMLKEETK
jgi:hypothetical protein